MAQNFTDTYGIESFRMLWDPSFESWRELGVFSQPAGFLLTADGTIEAQWQGAIPEDAVLERVAELS